jgi:phosphoglycolate phosphatase-like HAD superfamily hydrolase
VPPLRRADRRLYNDAMHVLLFDIDGTLISTGGAGKLAFERALADQFGIDAINTDVPFAGRTDRAIVGDLFRCHGIADGEETWHQFLASYLTHLRPALHHCQGRVLPGMAELIEEVAPREDVLLGLLTGNVERGARMKLAHYRLVEAFAFGGFGDHCIERNDVALAALESARRYAQAPAEELDVYVIGDTPYDVRCGKSIRATVIAVATGGTSAAELATAGADVVYEDLSDTGAVLAMLDAKS